MSWGPVIETIEHIVDPHEEAERSRKRHDTKCYRYQSGQCPVSRH